MILRRMPQSHINVVKVGIAKTISFARIRQLRRHLTGSSELFVPWRGSQKGQ
jgi:hypothetical protein